METNRPQKNLLICPNCLGFGFTGEGKCISCAGIGQGFLIGQKFFYWGRKIDTVHILQTRLNRIIERTLDVALFIFGVSGFIFLGRHLYETGIDLLFSKSFWLVSHPAMVIFWISIFFDLFLFYRILRRREHFSFIEKKFYGEENKELSAVIGWEEINKFKKKRKIDISGSFTPEAMAAIEEAYKFAKKYKHQQVELIHLFYSLLLERKITTIFVRLGVDFDVLKEKLSRAFVKLKQGEGVYLSLQLREVLLASYREAYLAKEERVATTDLLLALIKEESIVKEILYDLEIDTDKIINAVSWIRIRRKLKRNLKKFKKAAHLKPGSAMNRAMTALATPYLDRFSEDLTWLAKAGYLAPCVDREREVNEIFRIIEGGGQSVILVGKHGVGKNTIIEGIAWRMVEEDVPHILKDKRLVSLSVAELLSGATPAEAEERLLRCLYEAERARNVILVVPKIHGMVGITAGGEESLDLSEVLVAEISKGNILIIATALDDGYAQFIENKPIGSILKKVDIEEMNRNAAIQVLEVKSGAIEYQNKIFFAYGALERAVDLSERYIHEQYLPSKAIDIIKEAAVEVKNKRGPKSIVSAEDVAAIVAEKTKIPVTKITEKESEKLLNLEEVLHQSIIGQDEAVSQVSAALRRARAELREANRPIASFLFLGPTGVGKTELAKTVAKVHFGSEEAMIRLDMSEYQEQTSIYRLIGAPDGKGLGYLTEAVRKNPFSLLLLDELEKAHKDILDLFLQVMDDGRLTDAQGRTIDFTNVIMIATSNAGTSYIQDEVRKGIPLSEIKEALINRELRKNYRPEFLNRFDAIIVFKPLSEEEIKLIAGLMLKKVAKRLEAKGIVFRATDEAIGELAAKGFDPVFGARPMRRVIQDTVDNALANYLLKGKLGRRDVAVLESGGIIRVEKAERL